VKYLVYTDGSASVKDRTGGYAWKIVDEDGVEEMGGGSEIDTTISRMELRAAISALDEINLWGCLTQEDKPQGVVLLYSDSEYLVKGFMDRNRARNKNTDLWDDLDQAASWFELVHMEHVKGHAGHADNEDCDKLAGEFRQAAVQSLNSVVHCQRDPYDVYIGRANRQHGLAHSKWRNPFKVGRDGTRAEVLELYRKYVVRKPELMDALGELDGKVLGCWCAPEACHGHVLLKLLRSINA
jgi:ribonuclease HI